MSATSKIVRLCVNHLQGAKWDLPRIARACGITESELDKITKGDAPVRPLFVASLVAYVASLEEAGQ